MTPEIKKRIEQIQRGEVPDGYKKTKAGTVPISWNLNELGELFAERKEINCEQLPLLSITGNRGVIPRLEIEGKDNSNEDKSKYLHICVGDIGYNTMRMWQGVSSLSKYDGIVSPAYTVLSAQDGALPEYFAYVFKCQSMINIFYRNSQGLVDDTRSLKYEWFKRISVAYPHFQEQQKIADILTTQDKLIKLQRQKIEETKKLKKACLAKMFPLKGSNVPDIRFPGFTEAWKQRKVGELASDIYGGGTPSTSNESFWVGTIPWIQSSDLTEHQVFGVTPKKYISKAAVTSSATKVVPENSLAIITRVGVGKLAVMPFSYATSQDFLSLSKLKTDVNFTAYLLYKKLQSELNSVQGTSIKGITKDELLAKIVAIPERREQEAIGTFFRNLDNLITLNQRKLDEMQKYKNALMQLLLTGIVRVKV